MASQRMLCRGGERSGNRAESAGAPDHRPGRVAEFRNS